MVAASAAFARVPTYARAVVALPAGLFVWLCTMIPAVSRGEALYWGFGWLPQRGIEFGFFVDGLSLLFALLITGIGSFILLYASEYMRGYPHVGRFTTFLVGFMLSMLGLVLSDNLIALFVFWELTTITSFLLIGYFHEDPSARRSALQGLIVTGGGALAMLAGFVMLGQAAGTYSLREMLAQPGGLAQHPNYLAMLVLVLAGAFTKSAQWPFHFWLPNAMAAPTPVSAYLHSATMVKAGVFLLARTSPVLGGTEAWSGTLTAFGAVTAVYAAAVALTKSDLKQLLAYTTVMGLGACVMFLGLPSTGAEPSTAAIAAVTFLMVHALYKAALFMVAGTIDHSTGTRDLQRLGGLRRAMPWTFAAALLAGLSMAGVPPFLGFVGKELLYASALESSAGLFAAGAVFAANALIVTAALLLVIAPFSAAPTRTPHAPHEGRWPLWIGSVTLGGVALLCGVLPGPVFEYVLLPASASVTGEWPHYEAGLWHGFGYPLLLSAFTLAVGYSVYWKRSAAIGGLARLLARIPASGDRCYDAFMAGIAGFSVRLTRVMQCGIQRRYLLIVFGALGISLVGTILVKGAMIWPEEFPRLTFVEWGLAAVIVASAIETIRAKSRLLAICALGVVGAATALLFLLFGAPDVAMAQFTVETLIVVIVAMVLLKLPDFRWEVRPTAIGRLRDGVVSCLVGLGTALVLLAVTADGPELTLTKFFEQNSVPAGFGRNIVNVILVDFRALDTLGEITVLGIASLAAYTLVARRPHRRATNHRGRSAEPASSRVGATTERRP